ncbi:hypothetical protein M407DRAFT_33951 [Tulasnella calospora MUT 4182]|uniref:Uncharacterized protein n=1 Tax=Tulasnella calospora MUT 4182 TaxID=1051891 RepID=A0A0C3Q1H1_9AGAM|nr:hypothetical protein M407DRAFT_33951 [Tulasnella calospora MUT 4182]
MSNAGKLSTVPKTFSVAFPILDYLSLYFREKEVPQFEPDPEFQDRGFIGPLELDDGFSVVLGGDERAVRYFIGNLCQRNPTITMTQTVWTRWSEFNGPREQEKETQEWARVEKVARMICQTKWRFTTRI